MYYLFLQAKSQKFKALRASEKKINHTGGAKPFALQAQQDRIKFVKGAHLMVVADKYKKNAPELAVMKQILNYYICFI